MPSFARAIDSDLGWEMGKVIGAALSPLMTLLLTMRTSARVTCSIQSAESCPTRRRESHTYACHLAYPLPPLQECASSSVSRSMKGGSSVERRMYVLEPRKTAGQPKAHSVGVNSKDWKARKAKEMGSRNGTFPPKSHARDRRAHTVLPSAAVLSPLSPLSCLFPYHRSTTSNIMHRSAAGNNKDGFERGEWQWWVTQCLGHRLWLSDPDGPPLCHASEF